MMLNALNGQMEDVRSTREKKKQELTELPHELTYRMDIAIGHFRVGFSQSKEVHLTVSYSFAFHICVLTRKGRSIR